MSAAKRHLETDTQAPSLDDLAKEACRKHGEAKDAIRMVLNRLKAEPSLFNSLIEPMVERAVASIIYSNRSRLNDVMKYRPCDRGSDAMELVSAVHERSLMEMLVGGRRLGDMTGAELLPESETERKLAEGHRRNADFFAAVASQVPQNKRVRDSLTPEKLRKLWNSIMKK